LYIKVIIIQIGKPPFISRILNIFFANRKENIRILFRELFNTINKAKIVRGIYQVGRDERLGLIKEIEGIRDSTLIVYIAGDRENVSTRIAPDAIRVIFRHLEMMEKKSGIDLFLYTRGGDVLTPWRLVNLFREYTSRFNVIVPFRAYSAGTLICLGANEIVMGKMGELGPIDPMVANAFNPKDPTDPTVRVPISVEDVSSYLGLAQEKGQLKEEESLVRVFSALAEKVHPLALGNVHRNYRLIRSLARKLLKLSDSERKESEINAIVDFLTKNLYAHNYMISRDEARKDIGLKIIKPVAGLEELIWQLYLCYEDDLKLQDIFSPTLQQNTGQNTFQVYGAMIESIKGLNVFVYHGRIESAMDGKDKYNISISDQKWEQLV
jgi:hypothetical protein